MGKRGKVALKWMVIYGLWTASAVWASAARPALVDPPSGTQPSDKPQAVGDRPSEGARAEVGIGGRNLPIGQSQSDPQKEGTQQGENAQQSESGQPRDSRQPRDGGQQGESGPQGRQDKPGEQRSSEQFFRVRRDARGRPVALETAIVHYRVPGKDAAVVQVDLVAAVHVGERSYYEELNRRFAHYDAVLFEMVAPEDLRVPEGAKLESQTAVGFLQKTLQSLLGLEYQLHAIDYSRANFVHADMSPKEFAESMQKRGESFWQIFWKLLQHGLEKQTKKPSTTSDAEILLALFRQDRLVLKRILAEEIVDTDDALAALSGDDGSSTLITERNKKALQVLRRELDAGKKRIAIFYGAGHLPDMEARLIRDFRAERQQTEWIVGWDLQTDHSRKVKPAKERRLSP